MKSTLTLHVLLCVLIQFELVVTARKERNVVALEDEEYDIMIRRISGHFGKPLGEHTLLEKNNIRKYYR